MNTEPATILASEVHMIESVHTGRTYRIIISLPYAYSSKEAEKYPFFSPLEKWPVVYLLDANWLFGMVTDIVRSMAWYGTTTDAIVVGIGYPEDDDMPTAFVEAAARRATDFTPVRDEWYEKTYGEVFDHPIFTGDADNFHKFLKEELIPMIEEKYQADPSKRILAGHSLGGLFGTYALLHEPELFNAYVVGSPYLRFGSRFMFGQEEAFSLKHKELNARAYFTVGENEETVGEPMVSDFVQFAANLEARNYEGFTMFKQIFDKLNHPEVIAPGFQAGLMWALQS